MLWPGFWWRWSFSYSGPVCVLDWHAELMEMRMDQIGLNQQISICQDPLWRSIREHAPLLTNHQHPRRNQRHNLQFMGSSDDRFARCPKLANQIDQYPFGTRVQ